MISLQRLLIHQPPRHPDGIRCDLAVLVGRKIVRSNRWRLVGPPRADAHGAARGRLKVAGADCDGGEAVQGVAELVERQGLDEKLDVGTLAAGMGTGEDAEL